tara:strand:+ start:768 stop:1604 length:837 start_codon:yes stop_codon:yes gene_type:complete
MAKTEIGIQFPTQKMVLFSELEPIKDMNRDEYKNITSSFTDKITTFGFMDTIKVFPKSNGRYKIAEATHRFHSLQSLSQGKDFEIPVAILDWKDGDDSEEVLDTIIEFNNTGKAWNIFDYVKANASANHHNKKVRDTFKEIFDNMKRLKPRLTNAVVAGIYTSQLRGHNKLRDTDQAKKFFVTNERRIYVDTLLDRLENLVNNHGKKFVNTQFLRRFVYGLNRKANDYISSDMKSSDAFKEWDDFFTKCLLYVDATYASKGILPEGDDAFNDWLDCVK